MDPMFRQRRPSAQGDPEWGRPTADQEYEAALSQGNAGGSGSSGIIAAGESSPGTLEQGTAAVAPTAGATQPMPTAHPFHSEHVQAEVALARSRPHTLDDDARRMLDVSESALGDRNLSGRKDEPDYGSDAQRGLPRVARLEYTEGPVTGQKDTGSVTAGEGGTSRGSPEPQSNPEDFGSMRGRAREMASTSADDGDRGVLSSSERPTPDDQRELVRAELSVPDLKENPEGIEVALDGLGQQDSDGLGEKVKTRSFGAMHLSAGFDIEGSTQSQLLGKIQRVVSQLSDDDADELDTEILWEIDCPREVLGESWLDNAVSLHESSARLCRALAQELSTAHGVCTDVGVLVGQLVIAENERDWYEGLLWEEYLVGGSSIVKSLCRDVPLGSDEPACAAEVFLQTRTVSIAEARKELALWIPSALEEVTSLEQTNQAVLRIVIADIEELIKEGKRVVQVPGKAVLTRKAGIGTALCFAAYNGWAALSADIRFRDKSLRALTFQCDGTWYALQQGVSDDSLWFIVKCETDKEDTERWHGILIIYVDDLLGFALSPILSALFDEIQKMWKLSDPEWIGEASSTTFCGLETQALSGGGYRISQYKYLNELFARYNIHSSVSSPLNAWSEPEIEHDAKLETIREAQALTGALLWASSKTRPDIAFVVSKLGQYAVKSPSVVIKTGRQVLHYLYGTADFAIEYRRPSGSWWLDSPVPRTLNTLELFTDASHAPEGGRSCQAIFILWCGTLLCWESSKQPFITLSSAECELVAVTSGIVAAESVGAIIEELISSDVVISTLCDNQATVRSFAVGSLGWRNRHLRMRAASGREKIDAGSLVVSYVPGQMQLADLEEESEDEERVRRAEEEMRAKVMLLMYLACSNGWGEQL
ncbi:TY1B-NL2 [Symbiodinium sp. CCMP2592]|nr:TY1B-NL2 [Symbiodinium sp. CCMP2592]